MKQIYGLIGYPVKHSLSARMHNAAFASYNINAEYRLFEVRPEGLKEFFGDFRKKNLCGINVTIPHKTAALYFMDDLSDEAKLIEAVNTVVLKADRLIGHNTDCLGFIRSLKTDLGFEPKGKRAFILGAGGAGRAVSFGLAKEGLDCMVFSDVDMGRSAALARDIEKKTNTEAIAVQLDKKSVKELILNSDLLVNATPIGMKAGDPELIPQDVLRGDLVVFDLIYNPKETALIKSARKNDLKAVNGLGMLIYQGAAAFELWTGKKAPIEIMRKAVEC